jgi:Zn-dependent M28 family amino/carboxypeptidase
LSENLTPAVAGARHAVPGRLNPAPAVPRSIRRCARRWPLVLTLLVTACIPASPTSDEFAKAGQAAFDWTRRAVELGPRPAGSEAHRNLQRLIGDELRNRKATVVEEKFTAQTPNGPLPMNNIIGKFPGRSGRIVVVSGHYDTYQRAGMHFVGANDAGSSTGFLLALGAWLRNRQLDDEVWLVFFDGEESIVHWQGNDHTYGSRYLAERWREDGTAARIKALINVDMIGDADLSLVYEQNSTPWLRDLIWKTAHRLGYEKQFPWQPPGYIEDDHLPFVASGYSAVDLIDLQYGLFNRYWHTEEDTLDKLSPASFAVMLHVVAESLHELAKMP